MNVSMPIAAVLIDLDFPPAMIKAIPILARTAGLLAHLAEEQRRPIGFLHGARMPRKRSPTTPAGAEAAMMHEPEIETLPWEQQAASTTPLYREQIALPVRALALLPREARGARASPTPRRGRRARRHRAAAADREGRAAAPAGARTDPIGTHLAAPLAEIVRIFSTSGTTGVPSYIPLTAGDLDNWIRTSRPQLRRLRAAARASGSSRPTTPGRSWPGRRSTRFDRLGLCHIPVGTGQHRAAAGGGQAAEAADRWPARPPTRCTWPRWARARGIDLPRQQHRAHHGRGRARRRRAGTCGAQLEAAWGAQRHRGDGHRRHLGLALGRVRGAGRHALLRPRLRAFRADRPARPATPVPVEDGAEGELVYTHLGTAAAPLLRFRSRDHVVLQTGPAPAGAPRRGCAASVAPTTC